MAIPTEDYSGFLERISSFQPLSFLNSGDNFTSNLQVREKVDENGAFKDFFGDTVVFDFTRAEKERLRVIQKEIYEIAGDYLAEKLNAETFHMTLHDLSASPSYIPIENNRHYKTVYNLVSDINTGGNNCRLEKMEWPEAVNMELTWIFNMNNTSIVCGLSAEGQHNYNKLMALYRAFDKIAPSPYPFTPHITIAYFMPRPFHINKNEKWETEGSYKGCIPAKIMEKLANYAEKKHKEKFFITLRKERLKYCSFTSMNNYEPIV